jgi:hypothetical protein
MDDVQRTLGDVRIHVKALRSDFLLQIADQDLTLLREQFHEALQDLEVEGWRDPLPVGVPLLTCGKLNQNTSSSSRFRNKEEN